ncbi:MAG: SUMF1/EgtB/PvdO family nonheme iron enzyme [Rhodospirillales bacterium]|nr:SUMF1/EgtB/PvdO family nonheme iron enzyme [Rhodospirillales bacterium]
MSKPSPAPTQGAVGRADLLRLLKAAPRDSLMLNMDATGWFGYVRQPEAPPPPVTAIATARPAGAKPAEERRLPLRLAFVHAVVRRESRQPPELDAQARAAFAQALPIDEESARSPSDTWLFAFEDLVPQARLVPALRRLLGATREGALDLDRIIDQVAASRLPRRLPRRVFQRWHPDLVVLLDFCPRLWPYRWDMHRLAERLLRHVGRRGVSLRVINDGPFGPWSDWGANQERRSSRRAPEQPWSMPPAGAPVLIVSDLGMLKGPQSAPAQAWAKFVKALFRFEARPMALVPLGAGQLGAPVPPSLPILRWSPDARPRPVHARGVAKPQQEGLDDLLAMVATTRRVDPALLRAMRRLGPRAPLNAGLEGALWCHPDVEGSGAVSIREGVREEHLRHFAQQLPRLHARLNDLRRRYHAHFRAILNHEETLLWAAHADASAVTEPMVASQIKEARQFMWRLAATLNSSDRTASGANWWWVAQNIVERADAVMGTQLADVLHTLLAVLVRAEGEPPSVPAWADPAVLAGLLGTNQPATSCWLVQDAASGSLVLQGTPPGSRQSPLGAALTVDAGGVRVIVGGHGGARWLSATALPARLAPLGEPTALHLETAHESVLVAPVRRPLGARAWGWDRDGLFVRSAPFGSWQKRWSGHEVRVEPIAEAGPSASPWALAADAAPHPEAKGALSFGIEPRFGVFAELTIATEHGRASQRLRWIEPGTFVMGSTGDEPGRYSDEGPQHAVTISHGFWLFDTPCCQALWQVVMGDNPSEFKSPDRPVEQVSWDDVQKFLKRINALVPGLDLVLPSGAEWEYACRAGTETALYSGDIEIVGDNNAPALDPIAWYGGNSGVDFDLAEGWDSSRWSNKQYPHTRAGTRPVGLKEPNAWGLYDMLGNVWEWCADGKRSYTADAVIDPLGRTGAGVPRVLRGGSWSSLARSVRSACRDADGPGSRSSGIGFRCARVQEGREPGRRAGGPKKKKSSRGSSKPPEAAA